MTEQDQIESVEQAPESQASDKDLSYAEIVKGEASKPQDGEQVEAQAQPISPEDAEYELPGSRKVKAKDILEWEKGYMRQQDYTKKTQSIAEFRKSLEDAFGRNPDIAEIQALGKVVQNYYKDPKVQKIVDSIIAGKIEEAIQAQPQGQNQSQPNPEVRALERRIDELTAQLEQREFARYRDEAERSFQSWSEKRKAADPSFEYNEEIDRLVGHFGQVIRNLHPEWDNHKVLDEAYRYATIDNIEKSVRDKVLQSADGAKKTNPPKITSKAPQKTDKEMSYKEILLEAQKS